MQWLLYLIIKNFAGGTNFATSTYILATQ